MKKRLLAISWLGCGVALTAPAAAEFDVASVKQVQSLAPGQLDLSFVGTSGKPFKISGNRVSVHGSLRALIADAYGVKDYQISGTPGWGEVLLYTIDATTSGEAAPTQEQVRPMLQALLADRFQLKFHRETKELPVYHLTRAKITPLFKQAGAEETFSWNLTPAADQMVRSKATKESMGDFVQLVGVSSDRPVIDKTGITGDIDYDIKFSQDGVKTQDDMNRAIVEAVKQQLGMKLEPARDPIDLLVVDHAEKPSAN